MNKNITIGDGRRTSMKWKRTIFSMQIQLTCNVFVVYLFLFIFIWRFSFRSFVHQNPFAFCVANDWRFLSVSFDCYPPEWTTTIWKPKICKGKKLAIYFFIEIQTKMHAELTRSKSLNANAMRKIKKKWRTWNGIFAAISLQKRPPLSRIYIWLALVCFRGLLQTRAVCNIVYECEWAASARAGVRYLFANRSRNVMVPQTCTQT